VRFFPLAVSRKEENGQAVYGPDPAEFLRLTQQVEQEAARIGARVESVTPMTASVGMLHHSNTRAMGSFSGRLDYPGAATCGVIVVYSRTGA
jgi:hypothetical protein